MTPSQKSSTATSRSLSTIRRRGASLLARDALGIRPLYYFRSDRLFAFASEIKALLAHPDIPTAPSMEGVADFMMIGARPIDKQEVTCFEDVFSLVPAHLLVATPERIVTRRYWDFDGGLSLRLSSRRRVRRSISASASSPPSAAARVRAPGVAVSISGGFDSSSILCQALTLNRDRALCPAITGISYLGTEQTEADERHYLTTDRDAIIGIAIERFDMEPCSDSSRMPTSRCARSRRRLSTTCGASRGISIGNPLRRERGRSSPGTGATRCCSPPRISRT